jgi:hypothetical protein
MVVVHIRFTSEGPLFFLQCLTASTARPSRARGLYQRRYIYTCMYIYSTGRKKEKKKANGVCVCVLCIYLHASGHPSKRRAAASASRPFFIGAVMLGASWSSSFHGSQRRCEPFGALPILLGIFPFITLLFEIYFTVWSCYFIFA